ncbi:MAG: phosphate/phosphite/phosphonate ABC transporter substrate-binding protein [Acidobacteriota bacterium]
MSDLEEKRADFHERASVPPGRPAGIPWLHVLLVAGTVGIVFLYVMEMVRQYRLEPGLGPRFSVNLEPAKLPLEEEPRAANAAWLSLRIAIAPVISPEKSIEIYRDLARYVAAQLEREAVVMHRATYSEINELVRYRRCDLALVCTYPFVRGEQDFGMEVLVVPQVKGSVSYYSLIIVTASADAGSILDLRNKRFACADLLSNSGWLFPATWLQNQGEDPDSFFSEVVVVGSHDRSIQAVVSGFVDGAAVDSLVYETVSEDDPSIARRVKVIQKSPPFGMPPLVVHPQMDPELKSQLRDTLLKMHENPNGKTILSSIGIDRFVVVDLEIYDSVRRAAKLWETR